MVRQIWGGDTVDISYVSLTPALDNAQAVTKTIVNDRVGNVREFFYDQGNRLVMERDFTGRADPAQPTTETANRPAGKLRPEDLDYFQSRYEYNSDFMVTRITYPNGNLSEYIHEGDLNPLAPPRTRGNLLTIRHLPGAHAPAGDQDVLSETIEYDTDFAGCCGFNFVTRHVDARGNETRNQYDERGNLTNRIHRIPSIAEQFEYNPRGQMTKHVHSDNGSGHRRLDMMTYYDAGPQRGYLHEQADVSTPAPTARLAFRRSAC